MLFHIFIICWLSQQLQINNGKKKNKLSRSLVRRPLFRSHRFWILGIVALAIPSLLHFNILIVTNTEQLNTENCE